MNLLLFATTNQGKLAELRALVGAEFSVLSAADFPSVGEVEEDQPTFDGNALKKARAFAAASGLWALADDSGLCVDALQGRPGVHSARYGSSDAARVHRLLDELKGVEPQRRSARFICALALVSPGGEISMTTGTCEGRIGEVPKGTNGFGYDPIFVLPSGKTMAELTREEKSAISHRGAAFRSMLPNLRRIAQKRPR